MPAKLPLNAQELLTAQLLPDGALQEKRPAAVGGVAIVGEKDDQQEQHVDEEVLAQRDKTGSTLTLPRPGNTQPRLVPRQLDAQSFPPSGRFQNARGAGRLPSRCPLPHSCHSPKRQLMLLGSHLQQPVQELHFSRLLLGLEKGESLRWPDLADFL